MRSPDGTRLRSVRVDLAGGRMRVWAVDELQQPVLALDIAGEVTSRGRNHTLANADGEWVVQAGGCSCRCPRPLKQFKPPLAAAT